MGCNGRKNGDAGMDPMAYLKGMDCKGMRDGRWDGSKAKIDPDPGKILACGHPTIPDHRISVSVD